MMKFLLYLALAGYLAYALRRLVRRTRSVSSSTDREGRTITVEPLPDDDETT